MTTRARRWCVPVVVLGVLLGAGAWAAEMPFTSAYKVTEEATAPDLKLLAAEGSLSPSTTIHALFKGRRVTYLVMCNMACDHLRDTLRHVARWIHRYGEFGAVAHVFLLHESGSWPGLEELRKDFDPEVNFHTAEHFTNLPELMKAYEVDLSPVLFVSTERGFLMGRMTGYSPKDLLEWNEYFNDMFRSLVRRKVNQAPAQGQASEENYEW